MILKKIERNLLFILCLAGFAYTFPVYNKFWAPYDEGIITVGAQMLLAGEIPYKNFFIIMYPPGQVYVMAGLFKIFSSSLIAGRVYTVFLSVGISAVTFLITHAITKKKAIAALSWFLVIVSLSSRLGAIPSPIWPGMLLGLFALYAYVKYVEKEQTGYIFLAGIIGGFAILFRHDIGIFAMAALFGSLVLRSFYNKGTLRDIALLITGAFLVIFPVALYFISKSATQDIIRSLFLFPFIHTKTAAIGFPRPCFNLNMIFHGSLYFIKANQYYIPLLVYFFTSIYIVGEFFKKRLGEGINLIVVAVLLFGIFTFNQVRVRTDPAHLLTVIQPSIILFVFLLHRTILSKFSLKPAVLIRYAASFLILFLFVLLFVKNVDKYIKNSYRKAYKGDIIATAFDSGTIYLPKVEKDEVLDTVNYIKENTLKGEKVYVGNMAHWKNDFGGSTILYFLADRLPSTKYDELAPGLVTDPLVQNEIKDSLSKHDVNLIVLQDIDLGKLQKKDAPKGSLALDDYIERNFEPVKKFGKYNIYKRI